jgi:hypothetical protein
MVPKEPNGSPTTKPMLADAGRVAAKNRSASPTTRKAPLIIPVDSALKFATHILMQIDQREAEHEKALRFLKGDSRPKVILLRGCA